jgi:hypothetical protein
MPNSTTGSIRSPTNDQINLNFKTRRHNESLRAEKDKKSKDETMEILRERNPLAFGKQISKHLPQYQPLRVHEHDDLTPIIKGTTSFYSFQIPIHFIRIFGGISTKTVIIRSLRIISKTQHSFTLYLSTLEP